MDVLLQAGVHESATHAVAPATSGAEGAAGVTNVTVYV